MKFYLTDVCEGINDLMIGSAHYVRPCYSFTLTFVTCLTKQCFYMFLEPKPRIPFVKFDISKILILDIVGSFLSSSLFVIIRI